jgi:hypothetical protein
VHREVDAHDLCIGEGCRRGNLATLAQKVTGSEKFLSHSIYISVRFLNIIILLVLLTVLSYLLIERIVLIGL